MLGPGSIAPPFTLDSLDGASHSLAELLEHGPVLLAFFKISCPVCQMALPFLDRMAAGSLQIVAISQDDAASTRRFHSKFGVALPTLLDHETADYPVSNAFGISHVPSLFLVEPDGSISFASEGFLKTEFEALGIRAGIAPFRQDEAVPAWKAG
jgi:peroxiredoxin